MKLSEIRDLEKVYVYKDVHFAGELQRTSKGSSFKYAKDYLEKGEELGAIAFHLPLKDQPLMTVGDNLPPFFAGLLPEGLRLSALLSALKTSADDMFSMLAASGTNTIGDVYVRLYASHISNSSETVNEDLSGSEIHSFNSVSFNQLFEQSIGSEDYQSRVLDPSIPGVHPKVSAAMISFPVKLAKKRRQYILKLSPKDFPRLVENEHFFMKLAKDCGLSVANTAIVHDCDGASGLLVERFDRKYEVKKKRIVRLHQEDGCQFLNRYPQDKYRLSMREIASGIDEHATSPVVENLKLLQLVAFSYLICNGDLHAKNISLITDAQSKRIGLSPAYDLLATLPYGDQRMALEFEGKLDNFRRKDFIIFAKREGIHEKAVHSMLDDLISKLSTGVEDIEEIGFEAKKAGFLKRKISERLDNLSS